MPNITPQNYSHYVTIENQHFLDEALAQGHGVILPSVHINHFFYIIMALIYHKNRYPVVPVGNMENIQIFQFLANPKAIPNLHIVGADKFEIINQKLQHHARINHCLLLMHDMGRLHQLRTPFWDGKHPFLYHTPQSGIKLHQEEESVILPVVAIPSSTPGKQIIRFLDPTPITQVDRLDLDKNSKEYHGRISLEINKILAPYIMGFAHCWEEILNFANGRAGDEIHFEAEYLSWGIY